MFDPAGRTELHDTSKHRLLGTKGSLSGGSPLKPLLERMDEKPMFEALCFLGGMMVGGFFGVVIMCLFQINRSGKEYPNEQQDD